MLLADLVAASAQIGATRSRTAKTAVIAALLADATPAQASAAARMLAAHVPRLDVGWATVSARSPAPAATPSLTLADVDHAFADIAAVHGDGAVAGRLDVLEALLAAATADEQEYLRRLVIGEVRHGALEGVVVQGVAAAVGVDAGLVQRALMRSGELGTTAATALAGGADALAAVRFEVGRPVQPMLASTAADAAAALDGMADASVEAKLDGARVQVHRRGGEVRAWSRTLKPVQRPGVTAAVAGLDVDEVVLDGEVLAVGADGRPMAFQETMAADDGLSVFFFDCLRHDGVDLLDEPLARRQEVLDAVVPPALRVDRLVTTDPTAAAAFADDVLRGGHEGVVVKDRGSPYEAGRRGAAWRKVKPVHTLDLVVLAAEWGSGRRRGWLSNLHLGARDAEGVAGEPGGFVMLGKTFKGMTDEMLAWQTQRFLELETHRTDHVVHVDPVQVVEVAIDGVQTSTRYPGGVALRFARVKRYRDDKAAADADTIDAVRAIRDRT